MEFYKLAPGPIVSVAVFIYLAIYLPPSDAFAVVTSASCASSPPSIHDGSRTRLWLLPPVILLPVAVSQANDRTIIGRCRPKKTIGTDSHQLVVPVVTTNTNVRAGNYAPLHSIIDGGGGVTDDVLTDPLGMGGGSGGLGVVVITVVALVLVTAAQTLINSMLNGDQGLSAYLSDGSGYNKSGFKRRDDGTDGRGVRGGGDPLSWLRLPRLDFVEVAGQDSAVAEDEEALVVLKLDGLAERLRFEIQDGEKKKAEKTAVELESLMQKYGFSYREDSR